LESDLTTKKKKFQLKEKELESKKKEIEKVEEEIRLLNNDRDKKLTSISNFCTKFGGGSVAHVVTVLTTLSTMYALSNGNPALDLFVKSFVGKLEKFEGIMNRIERASTIELQAKIIESMRKAVNETGNLAPLKVLNSHVQPRLQAMINPTLVQIQLSQLVIEEID